MGKYQGRVCRVEECQQARAWALYAGFADGLASGRAQSSSTSRVIATLLSRWTAGDTPAALERDYGLAKGTLRVLRRVKRPVKRGRK